MPKTIEIRPSGRLVRLSRAPRCTSKAVSTDKFAAAPQSSLDLDELIALVAAEGWTEYAEDVQRTYRALTAPGATTLVAIVDGRVAGAIQVQSDGLIQAHVSMLLIGGNWRGVGLGSRLLREGLERAGGLRLDVRTRTEGYCERLGLTSTPRGYPRVSGGDAPPERSPRRGEDYPSLGKLRGYERSAARVTPMPLRRHAYHPAVGPDAQNTSLSVMLIVPDAAAAVRWYERALGAAVLWDLGGVAGLRVGPAPFFLHEAVPARDRERSPGDAGTTTTRIELFCDDPAAVIERAASAGAADVQPVTQHDVPWGTHEQGGFTDPFGHRWSVGDRTPLTPFPT